jgi:hypothetical protein
VKALLEHMSAAVQRRCFPSTATTRASLLPAAGAAPRPARTVQPSCSRAWLGCGAACRRWAVVCWWGWVPLRRCCLLRWRGWRLAGGCCCARRRSPARRRQWTQRWPGLSRWAQQHVAWLGHACLQLVLQQGIIHILQLWCARGKVGEQLAALFMQGQISSSG